MHTAEKDTTSLKNSIKVPSFSSSLNSEIDFRASKKEAPKNRTIRFCYTVGAFNILLEQAIKAENLPQLKINTIPHAPGWCSGMVNVRGIIIPVVNMHTFLKTGIDPSTRQNKLIMLEQKKHTPIIFQIDKLPEVVNTDEYTYAKAPENSPDWLKRTLKNGTRSIYEINHKKLLKQLRNDQL